MTTTAMTFGTRRRIPAGIRPPGFASMLTDGSSEMIHALLPIYTVTIPSTSTLAAGIVEGTAEPLRRGHHGGPWRRRSGKRVAPEIQ